MASGVINGTTSNSKIIAKIEWTSWLDTYRLQSYVRASLWLKRTNTGYKTYGSGTFTIKIGSQTFKETGTYEIEDEWVCIMQVDYDAINHDADGTKSIKISATGSMPGTSLTSVSCSKTVDLDPYQTASTFTLSGNGKTTAGNAYVIVNGENKLSVAINRQSSAFTHHVDFYMGSKLIASDTGVGTSRSYVLTPEVCLPLITDRANTTGLSNANAPSVKVTTYDASGKKIGDTASKRFDIYVPENEDTQPKVIIDSVKPVSSLSAPFNALYIQGLSKVQAEITTEGKYKAKISSCGMKVEGATYDADDDYTSEYFSGYGNTTVKVTAKDSRGISKSAEKTINVLPYTKPTLRSHAAEKNIICARCDKDGYLKDSGTYLKIKAGRTYQALTDNDVQYNFCRIQYRHKTEGGSYSDWKTILEGTSASDEVDSDALLDGALLANTSYVVQVRAIDDVGKYDSKTYNIPTDAIFQHKRIGGKGLGLGKYCEKDDLLDIAWNTRIRKDLILGENGNAVADFPIETGNENGWFYRKWKSGTFDMVGIFTVKATEAGTQKGVMYYSEQFKLPAPFRISAAIVSGTATEWFIVTTGGLSNGEGGEDPKENIGFRLLRPISFAVGQESSVRLYVTGTYMT